MGIRMRKTHLERVGSLGQDARLRCHNETHRCPHAVVPAINDHNMLHNQDKLSGSPRARRLP